MFEVNYYEVGDSYDVEGKGPFETIARFSKEQHARIYAQGTGNYGRDALVKPKSIMIFESLKEVEDYDEAKEKKIALSKLTDREKTLLGLPNA